MMSAAQGIASSETRIRELERRMQMLETSTAAGFNEHVEMAQEERARCKSVLAEHRTSVDCIAVRLDEMETALTARVGSIESHMGGLVDSVNGSVATAADVANKLARTEAVTAMVPDLSAHHAKLAEEIKALSESTQSRFDAVLEQAMLLVSKAGQNFEEELVSCRQQQQELLVATIEATVADFDRQIRKTIDAQIDGIRADVVEARAKWRILCAEAQYGTAPSIEPQGLPHTVKAIPVQTEVVKKPAVKVDPTRGGYSTVRSSQSFNGAGRTSASRPHRSHSPAIRRYPASSVGEQA